MIFVLSLALLFILRMRFPRNVSIAETVRKRYGFQVLQIFRRYEKEFYREQKLVHDLEFLKNCQNYDIAPSFLKLKINSQNFQNTEVFKNCQRELLKNEIENTKKRLHIQTRQKDGSERSLRNRTSLIDGTCLKNRVALNTEKKITNVRKTHLRKLQNLGLDTISKTIPDDVIVNLSNYKLSDEEKSVLSLGLAFSILRSKLVESNILLH